MLPDRTPAAAPPEHPPARLVPTFRTSPDGVQAGPAEHAAGGAPAHITDGTSAHTTAGSPANPPAGPTARTTAGTHVLVTGETPVARILTDLTEPLGTASSTTAACQAVVETLHRHTGAIVGVLLHVRDRLRCMAASGTWQVYSSIPATHGVVGKAFTSGQTVAIHDPASDPRYIWLGPPARVEICTPLRDDDGHPVGVLNVEWRVDVDVDAWRPVVEEVSRRLSTRISRLGDAPAETRSEQLLRHTLALTSATDEDHLLQRSIEAACDVSNLAAAVLLWSTPTGVQVVRGRPDPTATIPQARNGKHGGRSRARFAARIARDLSTVDQEMLAKVLHAAREHGAFYTYGDPAGFAAHGLEPLTALGIRTLIAVPVGPHDTGGVLLVVDNQATTTDPTTVNLLELLAAHAWTAVERLRTLRQLNRRASSDPLTGLRHSGPFGERLASASPGRTALLAIDIDEFKAVNDRYGHQAGDRVLVELARAMEAALRDADDLYRVGGDEFVAVLEVKAAQEAVAVAERLCAAARRTGQTVSIGVAVQADGEPAHLALSRADSALYLAKRTGRDGVRLASDGERLG